MKEKIDSKMEELKKRLGWHFYILWLLTYAGAGFLLEKAIPVLKDFVFGFGFQPILKTFIYYTGLGIIAFISIPITFIAVGYVYAHLLNIK